MKAALVRSILAVSVVASVSRAASADDRTDCLAASTQGQTLRNAHQLVDARAQFLICARRECPGAVQRDCGDWLVEVDKTLPTVVLSAKDGTGHDLFDVAVTVDDKAFVTKLDGQALPLDPGAHTFRFVLPDGTSATEQALVQEGQKAQAIAVVLQAAGALPVVAAPPPSAAPPPDQSAEAKPLPSERGKTQRIVGWVMAGAGVVALGVGSAMGLAAKGADHRAEGETGYKRFEDSGSAVSLGNAATVVFTVGAAVAAAGVVVWLTAPSAKVLAGTNGRELFVGGRF